MTESVTAYPVRSLILESLLAAGATLVLASATMGMVLDGYSLDFRPWAPIIAALVVFAGRLALAVANPILARNQTSKSAPRLKLKPQQRQVLTGIVIAAGIVIPFLSNNYWLGILNLTLIYVLLGLGLNIVVGLAGLLDLGFVAFYAVGAYTYALGNQYWGLNFWEALVLAAILSALCGAILGFPVLRLHGDYLAIVTLGFGEIIHLTLTNWITFTGGPNGANAPVPTFFGIEFLRTPKQGGRPIHEVLGIEYIPEARYIFTYLILFAVVIGTVFFVTRLRNMPIGRAWEALRENEIACKALGINHVVVKLSAFSMGACIGGIAGVFFAAFQGFIDPLSFTFFESALILAIVVLGGLGSTVGVILAAVVITVAPEFLREFSDYRILIFGILMIMMMIWKPRGLIRGERKVFDLTVSSEAKG